MSNPAIGNRGEKIIVFYTYKDVREFNNFNKGMSNLINGKVLQSTIFMIFIEDDKDKMDLPESVRFNYITKSDYNFFGQLKDKELRKSLKEKFDISLVIGNINEKHVKRINKLKVDKRIVTNSTDSIKFDISLHANATGIEQITNFVQETIEKIQS